MVGKRNKGSLVCTCNKRERERETEREREREKVGLWSKYGLGSLSPDFGHFFV